MRLLPKNQELRKKYKREFFHDATLKAAADLARPAKRKRVEAVASGRRVQSGECKANTEPFVSVSPFTELLDYHDPTKHCIIDPAHTLANLIEMLGNIVSNIMGKRSWFGSRHHALEVHQLQRFQYLKAKPTGNAKKLKATWIAKKKSSRGWEALESKMKELKVPKGWPHKLGPLFSKGSSLTVSECLLFAGPAGAYVFQHLQMDPEIRSLMIQVLWHMNTMQRKSSTPGDRQTLRKELAVVITELEIHLPVYMQTMVLHCYTHHMLDDMEATGPFHVRNMLDIERYSR